MKLMQIILAFAALMAPAAVFILGMAWAQKRRAAAIEASIRESAEQDERFAGMAKMSTREAGEAAGRAILRSVPRSN